MDVVAGCISACTGASAARSGMGAEASRPGPGEIHGTWSVPGGTVEIRFGITKQALFALPAFARHLKFIHGAAVCREFL